MIGGSILKQVQAVVHRGLRAIGTTLSRVTRPNVQSRATGTIADLARSKSQLIAENLLLRQQLIVLKRSVKRPRLTSSDRALFILLASQVQTWKEALLIIKPETILRWHRQGFQLFWKRKSRARSCAPKIPATTITLIKEMAVDNRLWGAERIRGELLKIGIKVAKRTVQRYMRQARPPRPHGQTWATFLHNHAKNIWACDFVGDIGGGSGHLVRAVLDAVPAATGVLFDLPHGIEEAAGSASERLALQAGDFFRDALPVCDAYLLMEIIHDWADDEAVAILRAVRRAAPAHATLLLIETIIPPDPGPDWSKMLDIHMLALLGGPHGAPLPSPAACIR